MPWAILLLGLLLSGLLASWFFAEAREVDAARFESAVTRLRNTLDERTERYAMELEAFTSRIAQETQVTSDHWNLHVDLLGPKGKLPALVELAYLTNTELKLREEVIELARNPKADGDGNDILRPILHAPELQILHQWTSGFPCHETAAWTREPATARTWIGTWNGQMIASGKRRLEREDGLGVNAVSFFCPMFHDDVADLAKSFPNIHRKHFYDHRFKGVILGTMDWQALLSSALAGETRLVEFEVFAQTNVNAGSWMGQSAGKGALWLKRGFTRTFQTSMDWPFFRQKWKLVFYSTEQFDALSPSFRGYVALAGGSMLSLLMSGLVAVQIRARRKQEIISGQLQKALDELNVTRKEREGLNHDLHDGTIQSLYALQLGLSRSIEMSGKVSAGLNARLEEHRRNLTGVIDELRGFILRHEAEQGPTGNLASVLESLIQRVRPATSKTLRTDLAPDATERLNPEQAVHLANLAREGLSNALRHANASSITVRLKAGTNEATLEIEDDGVGFDPVAIQKTGLGLVSMRARAEQAGGSLEIKSKPSVGTIVRVTVPLETKTAFCKNQ